MPQSRRNVLRAMYRAGEKAGLNGDGVQRVGNHDLRHTLVGIGFHERLSAPEVALLARHSDPRVTLALYAGLTDDGREQAAARLGASGFGS